MPTLGDVAKAQTVLFDGYSERDRDAARGLKVVCWSCESEYHPRFMGEDHRCLACIDPDGLKKLRDLNAKKLWAQAHADTVIKIVRLRKPWWWMWSPEDAARFAVRCVRACRDYQMAGGQ